MSLFSFCKILMGVALAAGSLGQEGRESIEVTDLLPRPDLPGWQLAGETSEYSPDSLYEYLDGAAPQYLSYGFQRLVSARYSYQGDDLRSVTLDLFEMQSPLGAYGIYSSGRPRSASLRDWGTEGYRSGTIAAAWSRNFYVHGSADEEDSTLVEFLERVVSGAIDSVRGESELPWMVRVLPARSRVPLSDRYVGKDLLGHSFLPGGLLAEYQLEDEVRGVLFVSDLRTSTRAREACELLLEYESNRGSVLDESVVEDTTFRWVKDPGMGVGAFGQVNRFVAGLWGTSETQEAKALLTELIRNLKPE